MNMKPKVSIERSEVDGVWVVHVDTDPTEDTPILRLYVNDGDAVYENPSFPEVGSIVAEEWNGQE